MKKSLYEAQRFADLESELDNAIKNYEHFVEVGDFNLAEMWMETINQIVEYCKGLEQ
jgi:hypothetical protein